MLAHRPPDVSEVHVIWMTTGLRCDGDSVSVTVASLPSIEDVVMGNIPGLPEVHLHNPVLAYEVGDVLAHGSGGKLSQQLIEKLILPQFSPCMMRQFFFPLTVFGSHSARISYVVSHIFFPCGNIGTLAVHGTVNDLAMCGARPLYLSAAFILEEGTPIQDFWRVVQSMRRAADAAGVRLVTGDTKVVDRGKADKIFINTSSVGIVPDGVNIHPGQARPGDKILVSGPIAVHGIAIMSVREGLEFETEICSDTTSLAGLVQTMLAASQDIHVLRDPTRGGVTSALSEIARSAGVGMMLDEAAIPVTEEVKGACEILGLDPLYVANEGKLLAIIPPAELRDVLAAMKSHPLAKEAGVIGEVTAEHPGASY